MRGVLNCPSEPAEGAEIPRLLLLGLAACWVGTKGSRTQRTKLLATSASSQRISPSRRYPPPPDPD